MLQEARTIVAAELEMLQGHTCDEDHMEEMLPEGADDLDFGGLQVG